MLYPVCHQSLRQRHQNLGGRRNNPKGHLSCLHVMENLHLLFHMNMNIALPMSNSIRYINCSNRPCSEKNDLVICGDTWKFLTNLWVKTPVLCINPAFPAPAPKTGTPALESETKPKTPKKLCISSKTDDKNACTHACMSMFTSVC